MNSTWLKVKVWTKLTIFFLFLIYILAFMLQNSGKAVTFWYLFFVEPLQTSLLYFTFFTFLAGVLVTILLRTTYVTVRQFREMRRRQRSEALERENQSLRDKASRLQTHSGPEGERPREDRPAQTP